MPFTSSYRSILESFPKLILILSVITLSVFGDAWHPDSILVRKTKKSPPLQRTPANTDFELPVESVLYDKLRYSIFEIVVPKVRDTFVQWEIPLPYEMLPFSERTNKFRGLGTAFAVGTNRFVSCAHVFPFEGSSLQKDFFIKDHAGKSHRIRNVIRVSNNPDVIEFDLETQPEKVIPLKISDQIHIGQTVYVVGNALGEGISFRAGQVASRTPEDASGQWDWIRFSAPASPGNSGGPLLTSTGQVIGIVTMKSQTENLNYAVPISEWRSLSPKEGHFHHRRIGLDFDQKRFHKSWDLRIALPKSLSEVTQQTNESINKTIQDIIVSEIRSGSDQSIFPFRPSLQELFRRQIPPSILGYLASDTSLQNWTIVEVPLEKMRIGQNQFIRFTQENTKQGLRYLFEVTKPAEMSLKQFITDPKFIADSFLKTRRFKVQMLDQEIPAVSFGTPTKLWQHFDAMGRPWQSAVWLLPERDSAVEQNCLATPAGAACTLSFAPSSQLESGNRDAVQLAREKTIVSFYGSPSQWMEYLNLGKDFVPSFLDSISVTEINTQFDFKFDKFHSSFNKSEWQSQGIMVVKIGFSPQKPYSMEPLEVSFLPENEENKMFSWLPYFEPMPGASDRDKLRWAKAINRADEFNGQAFFEGNFIKIVRPLKKVENQRGIEKRYVTICQNNKSAAELSLRHDCSRFNFDLEYNESLASSTSEYRGPASIKASVK